MRYFCLLSLMAALIACGSEKEQSPTKASQFVMPPETTGSYAGSSNSGQSPSYQDTGLNQDYTKPEKPSYTGTDKTPSFTPPKEVPAAPAPVQTQKEVVKGYTPSCCLVQAKAGLDQSSSLTGQSVMGCYALDEVCNVYPTQCLVTACPAGLVL